MKFLIQLTTKHTNIALLFVIGCIVISCEKKYFFSEYQSVNIKNWAATDTLTYNVKMDAISTSYQYSISVRHSKEYEFSNLWLKVIIKGKQIDTAFRYEIPLFKVDGKPYGKKSGSLITQTVPLRTALPLSAKDNYHIQIIQLMRKEPLYGIADIGLMVEKK